MRSPQDLVLARRTDWLKFRALVIQNIKQPNPQTTTELDLAAEDLQGTIASALQAATVTRPKPSPRSQLPHSIEELLVEKRRAKRNYQHTRSPTDKAVLNRLTNQVRERLLELYASKWSSWLEQVSEDDPPYARLWKLSRQLRAKRRPMPPIQTAAGYAVTDGEKAQALADSLELQFTPHPLSAKLKTSDYERTTAVTAREIRSASGTQTSVPLTCRQIQEIVDSLNSKKAPGLDGVTNAAIKKLPTEAIQALTAVTTAALRLCHFPECWKAAKIIGIPKPGKPPTNTTSYRPISLLSCLGKVLESAILTRLKEAVEDADVLPPEQHGFRHGHSTTHQLARVVTQVMKGFNRGETTAAIFLDVEKAFDKVWHERLLIKLVRMQLPLPLVQLIGSYLHNRTFQVQVGAELSMKTPLRAGVPQGSPLSPLLYSLYTADIPTRDKITTALYADDTLLLSAAKNRKSAVGRLNNHLKTLADWFEKNRIRINAGKTVAVAFNLKGAKPSTLLSLGGPKSRGHARLST